VSEEGRRRRRGTPPAGRAIGWWIAGFEERIYPQRETVEERVRWGTETRVASGEGAGVLVRFPGGSADHAGREAEAEGSVAATDLGGRDEAGEAAAELPDGTPGKTPGHERHTHEPGAGDPTPVT
jgi:hypothetical protein